MRRGALLLEVLLALALFLAVLGLGFSAIETGQRAVGQGRREYAPLVGCDHLVR